MSARVTTSTRDLADTRHRLETWFAAHLPGASAVRVSELTSPGATGMSSETLLFDVAWTDAAGAHTEALVARIAPDPANVPVFPDYDFQAQFDVMRLVGAHTDVPVPAVRHVELDPTALGAPFLVMERRYGVVPPDVMPYNFGTSWLFDATREEQARLQSHTIAVLAELHAIERPESTFPFLVLDRPEPTALGRHLGDWWAYYEWIVRDGLRSPLLERCRGWLEEHWPVDEGPTVFNWGDARIGNVMYDGFTPVAVLDWEMATLANREVEVAYLIYMHRNFEDAATGHGFAGMPHFLRADDVLTEYEKVSGHTPRDFEFYAMWNATRYGFISAQCGRRAVHFGERAMPDDVDDLLMNRDAIERMLAGTYWSSL